MRLSDTIAAVRSCSLLLPRVIATIVLIASAPLLQRAQAARPIFATSRDSGAASDISTFGTGARSLGSFRPDTSGFTGGVRVAIGNLGGGSDIIAGAGPGGGPVIRVYSGANHTLIFSFNAFDASFDGGVYVAAGDVDGDGRADIIVGSGESATGAPHVKVFDGRNGATVLADFLPFDSSFKGGVRVASGDLNGDGIADLVVGSGPGRGEVKVFSGKDLTVLKDFIPYAGYTGGIFVAAGDVDGDGIADLVVSPASGGSRVTVFSGKDGTTLRDFFAFNGATGGARVALGDFSGDRRPDIVVSSGPGDPAHVKVFDGVNLDPVIDFSPYGTATNGIFVGADPIPPAQPLNIATRLNVRGGDDALFGGFILTGTEPKRVLIRGIGSSSGLPGALADPTLELNQGDTLLASNDDWRSTQPREITATGVPPANDHESAIVRTLQPGSYTAILRGAKGGTGTGLVEVYDLDQETDARLANISTRGFVQSGDDVMIGGLILGDGPSAAGVLVRAIGPSLTEAGIRNALPDPTLALYDGNGGLLLANDDWKEAQATEIAATGIAPSNDLESAILAQLPPGNYTVVISGKQGKAGTALVEVYNIL